MPLENTRILLKDADRKGYAIGAFNINNLEFLQGVIMGAKEANFPVIVAVTEGAIQYAGLDYLISLVRTAANYIDLPISLHLDHGRDLKLIQTCIEKGFSSVMIDVSYLPFEENLKLTRKVVEMAKPYGTSVEAELGRLKGIEDIIAERDTVLVNPEEAEMFVRETGIDFLAPSIGTSHGAFKFKGKPQLDFDRLKETKRVTGIPLVLHGASSVPSEILKLIRDYGGEISGAKGVPDVDIKRAISLGVCKVNIDTDLRLAFLGALRKVLKENPSEYDPRKILAPARDFIAEVVRDKIRFFCIQEEKN